jgi:thiol-disulfide isomerase/thioredoxin
MMRTLPCWLSILLAASAMCDELPKVPRPPLAELSPQQYETKEQALETADWLDREYGESPPEAVRMLSAILRGSMMGGDSGWFGPAESRYTWQWLCDQQGVAADSREIAKEQFRGPERVWKKLDRDGDNRITSGDLDWSEKHPWVQQAGIVNRVFRRLNSAGDGRLTAEDLQRLFERTSQGREFITIDEFRQALMPPSGGFLPGDAPDRSVLVKGLFAGELGSMYQGPSVGEMAPDFSLQTPDGATTVQLSKLIGSKPVVLVLGNFTCGPFRAYYPEVENVYERFGDDAPFLMVYVREAHPEDGWKMESNARARVAVKQPTTRQERAAVCEQFRERLKPTIPVVVDEVPDVVGHLYSGMPARMYVIDTQGKVAYKSGRGPFGFRVGEMEQALAMALLETERE